MARKTTPTPADKRRSPGQGSIASKPRADGMWIATIEAGISAKGTRRRIRLAAKTREEVAIKLKNKIREINEDGVPEEGISERDTVRVWAERWIDITQHEVRPTTWKTNVGCIRKWVIPNIGHRRLSALTRADVRRVIDAQRQAGLAPSSIVRTHAVLMSMLKAAAEEKHKVDPYILTMKRPPMNRNDRGSIPLADTLAIAAAARAFPDGSRWMVQLLQGLRQAEALGLTWDRVHLDAPVPYIDISWQLQAVPYIEGTKTLRVPAGFEMRQLHKGLCLTKPKTRSGERFIPLIPPIVKALREWKTVAPSNPHNLVWARVDVGRAFGQPRTPHWDNAQWVTVQDVAQVARVDGVLGRRYGTHELRHTAATALRSAGAPDESIKQILGHTSILTSEIYIDPDQEQTLAALAAVGHRLQLG
jgi:integrase